MKRLFLHTIYLFPTCIALWLIPVSAFSQQAQSNGSFEPIDLPDYSDHTFAATTAPTGQVFGAIMSPEIREIHQQRIGSLATKGYIEILDRGPRVEHVVARMDERRSMALLKGRPNDLKELGFDRISNVQARGNSELPFAPTFLPNKYRTVDSEGFLLFGGNRLKQLHTNTQFGSLLIDEMVRSSVELDAPNIEVAGFPAVMFPIKHRANKWATVLITQVNDRVMIVECDSQVHGEERSQFLQMVSELVTAVK